MLAAALAAAGCGGAGAGTTASTATSPQESAAQVLAQTFAPGRRLPESGRVAIAVQLSSPTAGSGAGAGGQAGSAGGASGAAPGTLDLALAGSFEGAGAPGSGLPSFSLQLASSGVGPKLAVSATSAGGGLYVAVAGRSYTAPASLLTRLSALYETLRKGTSGAMNPQNWLTEPHANGQGTVYGTPVSIAATDLQTRTMFLALAPLEAQVTALLPAPTAAFARRALAELLAQPGPGSAEVWSSSEGAALRRLRLNAVGGPTGRTTLQADVAFAAPEGTQAVAAPVNPLPPSALAHALATLGY